MARVVNAIRQVEEAFAEVFERRAAPDDEVTFALSVAMTEDEDGDEYPIMLGWVTAVGPDDSSPTLCTIETPASSLLVDAETCRRIAEGIWDNVTSRRMADVMGVAFGGPDQISTV